MKAVRRLHFFGQVTARGSALLYGALLFGVLAIGLGVRLVDLKDPPLDFHASRQLRSAIIARSFYYQFDRQADPDLRQEAIQLGQLEMYEPPILEALVGLTDVAAGQENFWFGRVYNALFWCLGGAALFASARRFFSFWAALTGLAFFLYLPFSVIASRSFQPDPWMVMWILTAIYALLRWSERPESWKWTLLTGLAGAMALLVKIFAAFFLGPIFLVMILAALGWRGLFKRWQPWAMGLLVLLPSLAYYLFLNPQRSSDFFSFWVVSLSELILKTNFYADWLAMIKGLMGLTTFAAALLGVTLAAPRLRALLVGGWAGYTLYGLTFPYQYTTHEYYHLPLMALTALSLMPLLDLGWQRLRLQPLFWRIGALGVVAFASFYGIYVSRSSLVAASYEMEPASWRRVGEAIPAGKPFVALTADYGMRLNYYGWRQASDYWPSSADLNLFALSGNDPLEYDRRFAEMTAGKDYFLVTALSEFEAQPRLKEILTKSYPVSTNGSGFIVFDLTRRLQE
ncbi:MAG: glycosyltransferase family 39 protein [Anaerolineaceae bacterium]|nr:glycosyltransferase family 39 protein [Anaerolineaceae bacterium]